MAPSSCRLSANTSGRRGGRATRRGRTRGAHPRPSPRGRRSASRRRESGRLPARSTSVRRSKRAASNRMVGCGSQASCAPAFRSRRTRMAASSVARPVDLLRRRRGDRQRGAPRPSVTPMSSLSPPVSPPAVLTSTASGAIVAPQVWESARAARRPDAARRERCAPPAAGTPGAATLRTVAAMSEPAASRTLPAHTTVRR